MNLNKLTVSYIKDLSRVHKKYNLDTITVPLENEVYMNIERTTKGLRLIFIEDTEEVLTLQGNIKGELAENLKCCKYYKANILVD